MLCSYSELVKQKRSLGAKKNIILINEQVQEEQSVFGLNNITVDLMKELSSKVYGTNTAFQLRQKDGTFHLSALVFFIYYYIMMGKKLFASALPPI